VSYPQPFLAGRADGEGGGSGESTAGAEGVSPDLGEDRLIDISQITRLCHSLHQGHNEIFRGGA